MSLNPRQRAGVEHRGGPLLVLAGAGTGKTRVITHRVVALLEEGVRPWEILAVTFTNKAAGEMRGRILGMCEASPKLRGEISPSSLWVGTFHAICARILRLHGESVGLTRNFSIYDASDQKSLMTRVLNDLKISTRHHPPQAILGHIDRAKNKGIGDPELGVRELQEPIRSIVREAWTNYARRCRSADACDFGDLMVLAIHLLRGAGAQGQLADIDPVQRLKTRFAHVVVDEYQDTNPAQAAIVELLCGRAELCVVGDDDQSIYGWRGADVAQILDFPDSHPGCEVIRLEQNYRSTTHILESADAIIRRNTGRLGKKLWSELGEGELVRVAQLDDERMEARLVAQEIRSAIDGGFDPEEQAVFYRTHAQSRILEEEFRWAKIDYRLVGGIRFYDRAEIKDLIAYLRLVVTPASDLDLTRIINRPARHIGAKTVEKLSAFALEREISLFDALARGAEAGLGGGARRRTVEVHALLSSVFEECRDLPLDEAASTILDRTGYREALTLDADEESQARLENLQEFVGALARYELEHPGISLAEYLEVVSLASDADAVGQREAARETTALQGKVTLMTVHSAKGLEFERVHVCGMEDRVFPHARSLDALDHEALEEERRLAYVAVTRAKRRLTLTFVRRRYLFGQLQVNPPSRFLTDLPASAVEVLGRASTPSSISSLTSASPFVDELDEAHWGVRTRELEPREADWDDDIELDPDESQPLYVGMRVRHPKFGVGKVAGWDGSGRNMKLHLRFPEGPRTILARFCEPE